VALTLALVTLAALVLNAGLFWMLMRHSQQQDRIAIAEQLASYVAAALEAEVAANPGEPHYRRTLGRFELKELDVVELYVVDQSLSSLASLRGKPPRTLDPGFRASFFARETDVRIEGRLSATPRVVVTWPVAPVGPVVASLRLVLPLSGSSVLESSPGFLLIYVLFTGLVITLAGYFLLRRRLVVPIQQLRDGTERIASGDFDHRVEVDAAAELVALTESLNHLAASLGSYRLHTTEQVERLEETNQALAQAQEDLIRSARLASVGQLAAGIAHEVGNPLAAVVGYVELLREEVQQASPGDPELLRDLLQRTGRELERIHGIIRELLDYARPSTDTRGQAVVAEILRDTLETLSYQPNFREVEVQLELQPRLPTVGIPPDRLHQVLVNLLLNAADAMVGRGEIKISARQRDGDVLLQVRDSGPGIPPAVKERFFEPFFTTKPPGSGVGLGLATSQSIVQAVGGEISAENHARGGAVLSVRLPVGVAEQPP